ncbi:MAG: hypothetical protein H6708_33360 [Kofleriaceae bacterium]|nr:hypothetical protein [Myxococcales bacterium]MCB9565300.1 hypothetical protein [Kofleriaceae bacterium]
MTMREERIEVAGVPTIAVGEPDAEHVVVLLHGFMMEPGDLAPFAHSLGLRAWWLFPEAPLPASPRGRAWWHIDPDRRLEALAIGPRDFAGQHPPDLPAARELLGRFLDDVVARAAGRPLVVGGFSQGGMLLTDTLLRAPRPVDAVMLLSTSRIAFDEWPPYLAPCALRGVPVLISHGRADDDLAFATGEALRDCLVEAGADVTWLPFDEGHEIPLPVWRAIRKLVQRVGAR